MNYGMVMKDIRFDNDIKQKDMAKYLGISKSTYNEYEQQYSVIPLKYLIKFCDYFKVPLDYLFGFNDCFEIIESNDYSAKTIGKKIRTKRKQLKLRGQDLANILHINASTLSRYEKGKLLISTSALYLFCKKYDLSADEILGREKK